MQYEIIQNVALKRGMDTSHATKSIWQSPYRLQVSLYVNLCLVYQPKILKQLKTHLQVPICTQWNSLCGIYPQNIGPSHSHYSSEHQYGHRPGVLLGHSQLVQRKPQSPQRPVQLFQAHRVQDPCHSEGYEPCIFPLLPSHENDFPNLTVQQVPEINLHRTSTKVKSLHQ